MDISISSNTLDAGENMMYSAVVAWATADLVILVP